MPPVNTTPALFDDLKARFGEKVLAREDLNGREAVSIAPAALVEIVGYLKAELGYDFLTDLTAADYTGFPGVEGDVMAVSYQLFSVKHRTRAWLKAYVPRDGGKVATLSALYACANWYERECWDMYGVDFVGSPDQKRLLLYDEFEGHPLRKDYPILKMQPLIPMRNAVDYEAVTVARRRAAGTAGEGAE